MVVFLNTTTLSNSESGERLFDNFAPGAGAGLRVLLNKRSKTNLCFDIGVGRAGIARRLPGGPGGVLTG